MDRSRRVCYTAIHGLVEARPDFAWVGLGMPKQEKWMASHVGRIDAAALIGVGAAFAFHAETKPRDATLRARMAVPARQRAPSPRSALSGRQFNFRGLCDTTALRLEKSYAQDW
jgi:N-acetylglucosaminyldiphosphoundecaprenol N-acetyl-beta-D-mannosaminyltransferase